MKIDWERLWQALDDWHYQGRHICEECGKVWYEHDDWEDQKEKIQKLVEAQLRGKRRGKK